MAAADNVPEHTMSQPHILYGAEVSLYSGKTRAYLRYKAIPYEERLATLTVYREIIAPTIGRPIIPVVLTPPGEYLAEARQSSVKGTGVSVSVDHVGRQRL